MATDETVKLHITIRIDTEDDEVDTGLTLDRWNALSDAGRSAVVEMCWNNMAVDADSGGVSVVTDGAAEV